MTFKMFGLLSFVSLLISALGASVPYNRIVGGFVTDIESVPYQVSVQLFGDHSCGGSIIARKWILTAAHCTEDVTAECITVRAGSSYPDKNGDEVGVRQIVRHESFRDGGLDYDYALLELNAELTLDRTKQIVALPAQDEGVVEGRYCKVSGWGATKNSNDTGNGLRAVYVPIVSQEECRKVYSESGITDRMLCAGYKEGGRDSCQGDSGGPAVTGGKLVGVVSWGKGCAEPDAPGVYSRVAAVRSWITEYTGV